MSNQDAFKSILNMAIKNEIEAYDFYSGVAARVSDPAIRSIFTEMAQQEEKHRVQLSAYLDGAAESFVMERLPDYKVAETVEQPKLSLSMKPVDAIALAMKREEEARNAYQLFADASTDPALRQVFLELSAMENGHKSRLEELYTNMAFPEVW